MTIVTPALNGNTADVTDGTNRGMKYDGGKPRWSLLPWRGAAKVVEVLEFGAHKYAPNSWRTIPDARQRYMDALIRHVVAIQTGELIDPESGLSHIDHVATNALFLAEFDAEDREGMKKPSEGEGFNR